MASVTKRSSLRTLHGWRNTSLCICTAAVYKARTLMTFVTSQCSLEHQLRHTTSCGACTSHHKLCHLYKALTFEFFTSLCHPRITRYVTLGPVPKQHGNNTTDVAPQTAQRHQPAPHPYCNPATHSQMYFSSIEREVHPNGGGERIEECVWRGDWGR